MHFDFLASRGGGGGGWGICPNPAAPQTFLWLDNASNHVPQLRCNHHQPLFSESVPPPPPTPQAKKKKKKKKNIMHIKKIT